MDAKNCISYWFPRLAESGVPVPKTHILHAPGYLDLLLDHKLYAGNLGFEQLIMAAAANVGFPAFMRLGHASAKHSWREGCVLTDHMPSLRRTLFRAVEDSAIKMLPTDVVAVRQMLILAPMFTAFMGELPISREFRVFFNKDGIYHMQPYWPPGAIHDQNPSEKDWERRLLGASVLDDDEYKVVCKTVQSAARNFDGAWSIDLICSARGTWWVTDMAVASQSFHYAAGFPVHPDAPVSATAGGNS